MKHFVAGDLFAWGSVIHRAEDACEVVPSVLSGETTELVEFTDDCDLESARAVCVALNADMTHLVLGSDTGEDDSEDDHDSN